MDKMKKKHDKNTLANGTSTQAYDSSYELSHNASSEWTAHVRCVELTAYGSTIAQYTQRIETKNFTCEEFTRSVARVFAPVSKAHKFAGEAACKVA